MWRGRPRGAGLPQDRARPSRPRQVQAAPHGGLRDGAHAETGQQRGFLRLQISRAFDPLNCLPRKNLSANKIGIIYHEKTLKPTRHFDVNWTFYSKSNQLKIFISNLHTIIGKI